MIIKSLKLENYRRFSDLLLEFPESLIGIIGRNGSGKSTLIEAIGWVLYGNRLGRSDKHDIRSQHAPDKAACTVEMVCLYGDHEYKIVRKLKGANAVSEAAVYRDGQSDPVAVQDRGVNAFIQDLLQLDYNSFTSSVFARQKDLDRLSSLQPEERRQSINRLIGIDKIDSARSQVRKDRNNQQQYLNGKTSFLKDLDQLQAQLNDKKETADQQEKEVKSLTKTVDNKSKELEQAKSAFEKQTALRDQHLAIAAQLGKLETGLSENRKMETRHHEELEQAKQAAVKFTELSDQLAPFAETKAQKEAMDRELVDETSRQSKHKEKLRLQEFLDKEKEKAGEYEQQAAKLNDITTHLDQLRLDEEKAETQRKKLQTDLNTIQGSMKSVTREGKKEKEKLAKLQEIGTEGECPTCSQPLGNHYTRVIGELEQALKALRGEYKKFEQQEKSIQTELDSTEKKLITIRRERETLLKEERGAQEAAKTLKRIHEAIENFSKQLKLVAKDLNKLGESSYSREKHDELNKKYDKLLEIKNQAARYEEQKNRLPRIEQDLNVTRDNIARLDKEITEQTEQQQKLDYEETGYLQAKNKVDQYTQQYNQARDELASARENYAGLTSELKSLQKEIEEQKQAREEIKAVRQEIEYLTALDEHFGLFRTELANRVRPLIAHRASELLALTTHSRYTLLDLDPDYNINVYDGTESFPIQRFSGGEQDLANLCLRIAISQIVAERSGGAPINFIVLDEIFGSQDSERRDLILQALGKLSEQFRQVFLITHIEPIKDMLPMIIQVDAVDDNNSSAVLV